MKKVLILLLFLIVLAAIYADVPVRKEQFIYSVMAFNGKDYAGTFAGEDSDAIYLIANVDNFISARKTFVYFWPITADWKTDTSALNQAFEGTLELKGKNIEPQTISAMKYTYFNVRGEYELNWKVAKGEEADKAWEHYQSLVDAYWKASSEHRQSQMVFEMMMNELTKQITRLREGGKDISELLEKLKGLKSPEPPQPPKDYIMPPGPVQKAFILNLPVGEYRIRFIYEDGSVMEGSDRKVVVFEKRRSEGIGFEVIPGDKWTRPVESKTPSSVLYVDGTTDLYLRPFFQIEFNDLFYEKMRKNDSKGNPNLMKWVRIQQVPKARIEISDSSGKSGWIMEEPFYVEQIKGSALGYKIVPYDPEGVHKDRDPSLKAFYIPIQEGASVIRLRVQDKNGLDLSGSSRQIRVVSEPRFKILLLLLSLLPLVVLAVVWTRRSRKYTP